jgi:glutathione S-transferase
MGYLPMLEVDGKKICESMAIVRYIAREHGNKCLGTDVLITSKLIFQPFENKLLSFLSRAFPI